MAHVLRLNVHDPNDALVVHEVKKRIFLSLFMADRWYSFGLALEPQLKEKDLPSDHAIDERAFQSTSYGQILSTNPLRGLWAHRIDLVKIFGHIHALNHRFVEQVIDERTVDSQALAIAQKLERWASTLPTDVHLTRSNMAAYKASGQGGSFVDLHLGYHYYSIVLYFQYLGRSQPAKGTAHHPYVSRCRHHALAYSTALSLAKAEGGCDVVHSTVGHMTVVCSAVLLYSLLFGEEAESAAIRDSLLSNFQIISELETYWPALEKWVSTRAFTPIESS